MKNTLRGMLALGFVVVGCGDDGGDGGGALTLEDALNTSGTEVSEERAELLFPEACKKQVVCDKDETQSECEASSLTMYKAGVAAKFTTACLDATLDLYACFAKNDCEDFDTACNDAGQKQQDNCQE